MAGMVAAAVAFVTAVSGEGVACKAARDDKRAADEKNFAEC